MPEINDLTNEVTTFAKDAAHVVLGLGVLGMQKAQVQRVELTKKLTGERSLDERLTEVRSLLAFGFQQIDGKVEEAARFIEATLEPVEAGLPPVARDLVQKAHAQSREIRAQIRERVAAAV